jgi:hypothetical protein
MLTRAEHISYRVPHFLPAIDSFIFHIPMCQPILTRKSHRSSSHQSPPPPLTNMKKQAKRVDVYTNLRSQLRKASQIPIAAASSTSHRIREEEALRGVRSRHGGGERELERAASEADETGRGGFGGWPVSPQRLLYLEAEATPRPRATARDEARGGSGYYWHPPRQSGGCTWPLVVPVPFSSGIPNNSPRAMISLRFCGLVNV